MGNHPSVMIATISPSSSSFENTINSMRYAFRVKSMEEDGDSCANFKHTFMIAHEVTRDQGSLKAGAAVTPVKSRRSSQCTTLSSSRRRRTKSDVMAEKILPEYSKSSSTTSKHRDSRSGDSEGSITKPTFSSSRLRSSLVKSPATETESAPKLKYVSRALELVEMHKEVFDVLTRSLQQDLSLIHRKMNQNMDDVRYVDELGELVAVKEAALSKLKLTLTNLYTV